MSKFKITFSIHAYVYVLTTYFFNVTMNNKRKRGKTAELSTTAQTEDDRLKRSIIKTRKDIRKKNLRFA